MKSVNLLIYSLLGVVLATAMVVTVRAQAPVPVRGGEPPTPPPIMTQPETVLLPVPQLGSLEDVPGPVIPGERQPVPAQIVQPRPLQATFILNNADRYILGVEFFSETRSGAAWPGNGKEYTLGKNQTYSLSCNNGEKICVGAWRDNQTVAWGVGHGNRGCKGCCTICGSLPLELTLNDGGPDSFPAQNSGGQDINQVIGGITALINGVLGGGVDAVGPGCQASLGC